MGVKNIWILSLVSLILSLIVYNFYEITVPEEFLFKTEDFIRKYGYEYEMHTVKTEDHFLLTIYRMKKPNVSFNPNKRAVLWLGGIFATTEFFVMLGPGKDLAYDLVDQGFDLWLSNRRGSDYSVPENETNTHPNDILSPTFYEGGMYDVTAVIDYVLQQNTNFKDLIILGSSTGTTEFLITLSMKPEYNEKALYGFLLAPFTACSSSKTIERLLFKFYVQLGHLMHAMNLYKTILFHSPVRAKIVSAVCMNSVLKYLCSSVIGYIVGSNGPQNSTLNAMFINFFPTGYNSGYIKEFLKNDSIFMAIDFGREENLRRYKLETPPVYNLTNIRRPMRAYFIKDDPFIHPMCTIRTISSIWPVITSVIEVKNINHFNSEVGISMHKEFADDILKTISAL